MSEEDAAAAGVEGGEEEVKRIVLPLTVTIGSHATLLLVLQCPEANVAIDACKALLSFAEDEEDGATQIRTTPHQPVEPIQVLVNLLSHEEGELQGLAVTVLATMARTEEDSRLRTVELEGLAPMVKQLAHEDADVQAKAAYSLAMHAIDDPVRLAVFKLDGVDGLVKLLGSDDKDVLRNSCLALTNCAKHPETLPRFFELKAMKALIELLYHENELVQEQAAYTVGYVVASDDNRRDFRRLKGVDALMEQFASPSKVVQQAASFAMSQAAFDFEIRREVRAKDGIRPLSKLLASDEPKVVEQAMMAVANLALDVPTKQAIAVLGGMRFVAGLLSSSDPPVQANACTAIGRLVYDFNSAAEFNEQDGAALMNDIVVAYVASVEKFVAATADLEEGAELPDGVEEPDENVGHCLFEALCSVTEHGIIRQELRQKEGLLERMTKASQFKNPDVADLAATATANFAFDAETRPMMLAAGVVEVMVILSDTDRPEAQMAAARALGNFALDDEGRVAMKEGNAMGACVKLLAAKSIETRRTAIMAINMCARDQASAVELCNMGGLVTLLELKDTHWKQLGDICKDTLDRLFQQNPSAKFWHYGKLDDGDKVQDGFYDLGIGRAFSYVEELQTHAIEADIEILVANRSMDAKLGKLQEQCLELVAQEEDKGARILKLANLVSSRLGGAVKYDEYGDFGFSTDVQKAKALRNSNIVCVGDLNKGACRHRAFLFKYLCDQLGIECSIHRSRHVRGAHVGHAWNVVHVDYDTPVVVDLMHDVGKLYPEGKEDASKYSRLGAFAFATL